MNRHGQPGCRARGGTPRRPQQIPNGHVPPWYPRPDGRCGGIRPGRVFPNRKRKFRSYYRSLPVVSVDVSGHSQSRGQPLISGPTQDARRGPRHPAAPFLVALPRDRHQPSVRVPRPRRRDCYARLTSTAASGVPPPTATHALIDQSPSITAGRVHSWTWRTDARVGYRNRGIRCRSNTGRRLSRNSKPRSPLATRCTAGPAWPCFGAQAATT